MWHPVPARLKAYALDGTDIDHEVERHLQECSACQDLVLQEMIDEPEAPEVRVPEHEPSTS